MPIATAPDLTVSILRTIEAFRAVEAEWRELFAAAERPSTFQRHRWLRLSWELVWHRFPSRLRVILVRESGVLVMAGAFVLTFRRLVPVVYFLTSDTPQHCDLLWRASDRVDQHARLLLEALRSELRLPHALRAPRVREDTPLHAAVARLGLKRRVRARYTGFYVALDEYADYEAYFASLSTNLRSDHRRRLRRLGELAGFAHVHETGAGAAEAIRWGFDTKRQWLSAKGLKAQWLSSAAIDRFLAAFLDGDDDVPEVWIDTLRLGRRIMAAAICFVERHEVLFFKIAHDPQFNRHSPGRTLSLLLIEAAFRRGSHEFDLGHGTIEWKRRLARSQRIVTAERVRLK